MSERQHNITREAFSNLLLEGAFLRYKGQWNLFWGPFLDSQSANNSNISIFCPFFYDIDSTQPLSASNRTQVSSTELRQLCESFLLLNPLVGEHIFTKNFEEAQLSDFAESLQVIQNKITQGEIKKAVPTVFAKMKHQLSSSEKAQLILNLLDASDSLFPYGYWDSQQGVVGATPELLFAVEDSTLKTMALAGTCPKSETTNRLSLLDDEKEMFEHQLVVEDILKRLSPLGIVKSGQTQVLELPTLFHLKTDIEVIFERKANLKELCQLLHPTPALGVYPREFGYKWLQNLPDQLSRDFFGGPMGFELEKEAVCLVGIRNIQWNRSTISLGSGCGIVKASELEREWRELFQKRLSVKKILGLKV